MVSFAGFLKFVLFASSVVLQMTTNDANDTNTN